MAIRFDTKDQAQNHINNELGELAYCFSPCFVSDHYAAAHGVDLGGWYIMSNMDRRFI